MLLFKLFLILSVLLLLRFPLFLFKLVFHFLRPFFLIGLGFCIGLYFLSASPEAPAAMPEGGQEMSALAAEALNAAAEYSEELVESGTRYVAFWLAEANLSEAKNSLSGGFDRFSSSGKVRSHSGRRF